MIEHGIVVDDRDRAIDILKSVNYYRFTGYALQFRVSPEDSTYVENTNFDTVYNLYIISFIKKDGANCRDRDEVEVRQNAAFRTQQGEKL